jgi:hypothetical protein
VGVWMAHLAQIGFPQLLQRRLVSTPGWLAQ